MERFKAERRRLVPNNIRGRFCRISGASNQGSGLGDLRVSRCKGSKEGSRLRIDIRIREGVCREFAFEKGTPVLLDYEVLADMVVFCVEACAEKDGISLCWNKQSGNGDLRASFSGQEEEIDALFDGRDFFAANVTEDFGANDVGRVKFVCNLK